MVKRSRLRKRGGRKRPKRLKDTAKFYGYLWDKNKGKFYRGTATGKGLGLGALGTGLYLTWDKGMAEAFARISSQKKGRPPVVDTYEIPKNLNLIDNRSETFCDIKRKMGVECWETIIDLDFSNTLAEEVKALGYDGVISDNKADGLVIFDKSKAKKTKRTKIKKL